MAKKIVATFDRKSAAPVSAGDIAKAAKAIGVAHGAFRRADVTLLGKVKDIASGLPPITSEQWERQFQKPTLEALVKQGLTAGSAATYASNYKMAVLALASGLPAFAKTAGLTLNEYLDLHRSDLRSAVLANGVSIFPMIGGKPVPGKGAKPQTKAQKEAARKAKADKAKADAALLAAAKANGVAEPGTVTSHPMSAAKADDKGLDVAPALASACILTGENAKGPHPEATLLVSIMKAHKPAFCAWAEGVLAEARKANVAKATANANAVIAAKAKAAAKANGANGSVN